MTSVGVFFRKWGFALTMLIVIGATVWYNYHRRVSWKKAHASAELKTFETAKGWGYDILLDGKVFIHQDIVPAISSKGYGFKTKEDALAVGQKVYDRVVAGQLWKVSPEEIKAMGIEPDSTRGMKAR